MPPDSCITRGYRCWVENVLGRRVAATALPERLLSIELRALRSASCLIEAPTSDAHGVGAVAAAPTDRGRDVPALLLTHVSGEGADVIDLALTVEDHADSDVGGARVALGRADRPLYVVLVVDETSSHLIVHDAHALGVRVDVIDFEQIAAPLPGPDSKQPRLTREHALVGVSVRTAADGAVARDLDVAYRL